MDRWSKTPQCQGHAADPRGVKVAASCIFGFSMCLVNSSSSAKLGLNWTFPSLMISWSWAL